MALKDLIPGKKEYDFSNPKELEDDCLSCKIVGSSALAGLSFYTYYSGMNQLRAQRKVIEATRTRFGYGSRQMGIVGISATLFGMAWYRILN